MNKKKKFALLPLGGCGEIGMNMTLLFAGDEVFFIDCGALFPDATQPGVQLILPGFSYLLKNKIKPTAWLITHGHEDHIGGLPYFFPRFPAPIYTSPFSAALIEGKFKDLGIKKYEMNVWRNQEKTRVGRSHVTPFEVNHSIPDSMGLFVDTPEGSLLHTGDYRIDPNPYEETTTDASIHAALKGKRPDVMMSDSTNSFSKGTDLSENDLVDDFADIMQTESGAVIAASFSSNVWRVQTIMNAARDSGRGVHLLGRGTLKNWDIAQKLGIVNTEGVEFLDEKQMKQRHHDEICIICTGSQGEPFSGLHRLAYDAVPYFKIAPGDNVVFSARSIPGNEKAIIYLTNQLCRQGVQVITAKEADIHVSGHGYQEDLKKCIQVANPRNFMPVHGEYRHLQQHGYLALDVGLKEKNVILAENGDIVEITPERIDVVKRVSNARSYVSQGGVYHDEGDVLRVRQRIAKDGLVCVSVLLGREGYKLKGHAQCSVFGVPMQEGVLSDAIPKLVKKSGEKTEDRKDGNDDSFANELRIQVRRYIEQFSRFKCNVTIMLHRS